MQRFRQSALWCGACGLIGLILVVTLADAHTSDDSGGQVASLQDQLEKGLRARRPVEFQFVARVVQLVEQGRLSRATVVGTFRFVVRRYSGKKYLVPAFEQILRKRAREEGNTSLDNVPSTL